MKKFLEFITKPKIAIVLLVIDVIILTAGVPLFINWMFSTPAWFEFLRVDWEAKDALAYYGSALGFVGTVIFSGLALWQNHIIQEANDKHTALLEKMEREKNMPVLYCGLCGCWGGCEKLHFSIQNLSENIALEIVLSKISIINKDGTEFWNNKKETTIHHLIKESKQEIRLDNPPLNSIDQIFIFHITYQDKFGNYHKCVVEGVQKGKTISIPKFTVKEI